jgi:phosphonate transport system ATP-binding protein
MTSPAALTVRDVSKSFGAGAVLREVSLQVAEGEMVALIGPSGSGKSTLLRSIAGLTRIDPGAGLVQTFGEPLQADGRLSPKVRAARARIGFIFQQFNLVGRLSLSTNVALGSLGRIPAWRGVIGAWPADVRRATADALSRTGLTDHAAQRANTLSGGQQQRGAIARTLVQQARLILADEPVASLDPVSARSVMETLRGLNRSDGLSVLITLHQVDFALAYCDRIVALSAGQIAYDGPPQLLGPERLAEIYGAEVDGAGFEGRASP